MASLTLKGDSNDLQAFGKIVGDLVKTADLTAKEVSGKIRDLVQEEFASGTDPYGNTWVPVKEDGAQPLQGLGGGVVITVSKDKIKLKTAMPEAVHNAGSRQVSKRSVAKKLRELGMTKGIGKLAKNISQNSGIHDPKRQIIPSDSQGIPPKWEEALNEIGAKVIAKTLGKVK